MSLIDGFLLKYTPPSKGKVTIGGRVYPTVKIGNQWWMAENLDYKFNVNGSQISIGNWTTNQNPSAYYYNNDETSYGIDGTYKCGLLYNWYAAKYLEDNKATLLPDGWHVPTQSEFDSLITACGGTSSAGAKLKALNGSVTSSWPSSWNGTNDYGFNLLPSGVYYNGTSANIGTLAYLRTSTNTGSSYSYDPSISSNNVIEQKYWPNSYGGIIRLVKDSE